MSAQGVPEDVVVETDDRGRVSLARAGVEPNRRYIAHTEPDGTVVLSPATVVTTYEARFRANERLVQQIEDNRAHPERLTRVDRRARHRG